jgi:hypothetical protein
MASLLNTLTSLSTEVGLVLTVVTIISLAMVLFQATRRTLAFLFSIVFHTTLMAVLVAGMSSLAVIVYRPESCVQINDVMTHTANIIVTGTGWIWDMGNKVAYDIKDWIPRA